MPDLIAEVIESTSAFEAPTRFYYWSTLACISAVLKDKSFFDMGGNYKTYPNIYVLLYGPSGVRKGPPIALAEDLVSKVDNTRVIDGRSSIEAVIKELGNTTSAPGKPPSKDSCGFMVASELSASIIGNIAAMDIMTNLFDRLYNEKEWKYRLKGEGSVKLMKPCITWLAGTNEALFRDFMPEKNLHGGLIGRMFVITETKKARTNSLMFKTKSPDKVRLGNVLKHVAAIEGEFTMNDTVRHEVDDWYNLFDKNAPKDDTGFVSRTLDFVIKIAMILAAGRRQSKEITSEDVTEAASQVLPLIDPTKAVVHSIKKSEVTAASKRGLVLTYLSNRPEFKEERTKLLMNIGLQINHEDLDMIAQYMIQMETLVIDHVGGKAWYRLKIENPLVKDWIQQFRTGK